LKVLSGISFLFLPLYLELIHCPLSSRVVFMFFCSAVVSWPLLVDEVWMPFT
jgi:hypothetical protein